MIGWSISLPISSRLGESAWTFRFDCPVSFSASVPLACTLTSRPTISSVRISPVESWYVPSSAARVIARPPIVEWLEGHLRVGLDAVRRDAARDVRDRRVDIERCRRRCPAAPSAARHRRIEAGEAARAPSRARCRRPGCRRNRAAESCRRGWSNPSACRSPSRPSSFGVVPLPFAIDVAVDVALVAIGGQRRNAELARRCAADRGSATVASARYAIDLPLIVDAGRAAARDRRAGDRRRLERQVGSHRLWRGSSAGSAPIRLRDTTALTSVSAGGTLRFARQLAQIDVARLSVHVEGERLAAASFVMSGSVTLPATVAVAPYAAARPSSADLPCRRSAPSRGSVRRCSRPRRPAARRGSACRAAH